MRGRYLILLKKNETGLIQVEIDNDHFDQV